jgi:hypothetical protein
MVRVQEVVQEFTIDEARMGQGIHHPILTPGGELAEGGQETTIMVFPVADEDVGVGRVDMDGELEGGPFTRRGLPVSQLDMGHPELGVAGPEVGQFFFSTLEGGFEVGIAPWTDTANLLLKQLEAGLVK